MKLPSYIPKNHTLARSRIVLGVLFCFFVVLSNVGRAPANNLPDSVKKPASTEKPVSRASRPKSAALHLMQREGTQIVDCGGHFHMAGDRVAFFPAERKNRYLTLENLNVERIVQALADQPRQRRWKVTGTLTEYQGENYLLVEKALLEGWDEQLRKPR